MATRQGEAKRTGPSHWALVFTLAMVAVLALSACGVQGDASATPTPVPTAAPAAAIDAQVQPTATAAVDMPTMEMSDTPAASDGVGPATTPATSDVAPAATTPAPPSGATTEVQATLIEWAIQLSQSTVPAGTVRFTVTNGGQMPHNFTVTDDSGVIGHTSTFMASESPQTLEVTLKPGTYTIICSLPGHAARGQMTTLTVK